MKRRPFLASIAALIAAPFVAKKAAAENPLAEVTPEQGPHRIITVKSRQAGYSRQQAKLLSDDKIGYVCLFNAKTGAFDYVIYNRP